MIKLILGILLAIIAGGILIVASGVNMTLPTWIIPTAFLVGIVIGPRS